MENLMKHKLDAILNLKNEKIERNEQVMEIYVKEIGWLVLLLDDVEVVTDNWFSSTKYNHSQFQYDDSGISLRIKNVYIKNVASIHTDSNPTYNLIFDEINIFTDQIIACL
jgi:hypothetical protein